MGTANSTRRPHRTWPAAAGCAPAPPATGTVTKRIDEAKHCNIYDSQVPNRWWQCLTADPGDTRHRTTGHVEVDENTYDRYQVGDHYPHPTEGGGR